MTDISELNAGLNELTIPVDFWWRDDDCGRPDPRLTRLLGMSADLDLPLALAVVPAWLDGAVAEVIRAAEQVTVVQHGWEHADHATPGARKIELGGVVDVDWLSNRLLRGRVKLERQFGPRFLPVIVPPWNRASPGFVERMDSLGYEGLSAWPSLATPGLASAVIRRDAHVDPITWWPTPRYVGLPDLVSRVLTLIRAEHVGPIGLLSHHLVFDELMFADWARLLTLLRQHRNSRLLSPTAAFGEML